MIPTLAKNIFFRLDSDNGIPLDKFSFYIEY